MLVTYTPDMFGGLVPRVLGRAKPINVAETATNIDFRYADIHSHKAQKALKQVRSSATLLQTIFKPATVGFRVGMTGGNSGGFAYYGYGTPYVIVAGDVLEYEVFLQSGAESGAGNIDLKFWDAGVLNPNTSSLTGSPVDQNSLVAQSGNILPYATGAWYKRRISIPAGDIGKKLSGVKLINSASAGSTVSYAWYHNIRITTAGGVTQHWIWHTGKPFVAVIGSISAVVYGDAPVLDDEFFLTASLPLTTYVPLPLSEFQIASLGYNNGDPRYAMFVNASTDPQIVSQFNQTDSDGGITSTTTSQLFAQNLKVTPPSTAPTIGAITAGAAPTETRAYVYTFVTEWGEESRPSAAVTGTGNITATWTVNIGAAYTGRFSTSSETKKNLYRTDALGIYRLVATVAGSATSYNDAISGASLGKELPSLYWNDPPTMEAAAPYREGQMFGIYGYSVYQCEPYQYHAFPLDNVRKLFHKPVGVGTTGDLAVVLTTHYPYVSSHITPQAAEWTKVEQGEGCITPQAVLSTPDGVIYGAASGWRLVNQSGDTNITEPYWVPGDLSLTADTIAVFDNRRLLWCSRGGTTCYVLDITDPSRGLITMEVENAIDALTYDPASGKIYYAYRDGATAKIGQMFGHATNLLKYTWKSPALRMAKKIEFKKIQVQADFDLLASPLAGYEGTGSPSPGSTSGLVQSFRWMRAKVYYHADRSDQITTAFDDFISTDKPRAFAGHNKSDYWQVELSGNIPVQVVQLAESSEELKQV